jgi:hypothetical protein
MIKQLLALSGILFVTAAFSQSQTLRVGNSIVGVGLNDCSYSAYATNNCALTTAAGSLSGFDYQFSYNYTVLNHESINADLGIGNYTGGTGLDVGIGVEYHFHFSHRADPFDLYLGADAGYTRLTYAGGLLAISGNFVAPGIYYQFGLGLRRYIIDGIGLFINVNYALHTYSGGEVTEGEGLRIPYTIGVSGFNFGGGICYKFGKPHHS